jgi:large subunit ribosomal protein L32e
MQIKKKGHPRFNVPNFGAKNRGRVKESWRKQRGDDNKKRVKKAFAGAEPTIGYGNPESVRGVRANGRRAVVVQNIEQLKEVIENPDMTDYDVTLASTLSRRKRAEMVKLAEQNEFRVTNRGTK